MFTINFIYFTITITRRDTAADMRKVENDHHVAKIMKEVEEKRYEYIRFM